MYINGDGQIENKEVYNKFTCYFLIITFFIAGCILIKLCFADRISDGVRAMSAMWGMGLLALCVFDISEFGAKYEIEKNGIWIKYPFDKWQLVSWSEFQEVCVCYTAYNNTGGAYVIICFVKHGQKPNARGRWKTDNPFYHRSVIRMDYTYELHDTVKELCPYEVKDLRNTRSYKLRSAMKYSNK